MRIFVTAIIALVALAGSAFGAEDSLRRGPYMSVFVGTSIARDISVDSEQYFPAGIFNDKVELDPGVNVGLTGGYNFGFFRLEGELSYKAAEMDEIVDQIDGYHFRNVDGELAVFAGMVNGFFDLRNSSPVTPYFGGGVGFATVYLSDTYGTDIRGGAFNRALLYADDADSVLAYQVGGGLEIALNSVLSLDLSYRYFGTSEAKFNNDWDSMARLRLESHNAAVGLRVKF